MTGWEPKDKNRQKKIGAATGGGGCRINLRADTLTEGLGDTGGQSCCQGLRSGPPRHDFPVYLGYSPFTGRRCGSFHRLPKINPGESPFGPFYSILSPRVTPSPRWAPAVVTGAPPGRFFFLEASFPVIRSR